MTEFDWLVCAEPMTMLRFLGSQASSRKLMLFIDACLDRIEGRITENAAAFDNAATVREVQQVLAECIGVRASAAGDITHPKGQGDYYAAEAEGMKAQARFVLEVFGNPFRPVAFDPNWRTDAVVSLARTMYDSRDFGVMPILADALQEAGCNCRDVLNHCRGDVHHVRGCWVVDGVLGRG